MSVSQLKRRMSSAMRWMKTLDDGLNGKPHSLGQGEADAMAKYLALIGVTLISKSKASKNNLELRRGARPVVRRYFGSPISDWKDMYCLEQFKQIPPKLPK